MIKAVLFDWGGVLVSGGRSFWKYLTEETDSQIIDRAAFNKIRIALNKGQIDEAEFEEKFLTLSGAKKIPRGFWDNEAIINMLPEMEEYMHNLQRRGVALGLISNMGPRLADAIEHAGGYKYFDPLVVSSRVGLCKPDEAIFDLALEQTGLTPDEIIFVDDLEANLEYPQQIGMQVILAHNPQQIMQEVNQLLGEA